MPNIQEDLQKIMDARYGKDVRKSIHDAISDINDVADHAEEVAETAQDSAAASAQAAAQSASDAETSKTDAVNAKNAANTAKNAAQTAQAAAETAQAAAERAASTASTIAEDVEESKIAAIAAQVAAETAQGAAETAETGAQTAQTAAETARTGAQTAQSNAEAAVLDAEAYARGTRNGSPVPSTDPAYENNSKYYSEQIGPYALDSEAYAKGTKHGTPVPSTDPAYKNNSKYFMELANYWYLQAKAIAEGFSGALIPMGTVTFANLPALATVAAGSMYNISDEFTTTSDFKEGAGHVIPMGANVYKTNDGKWDVLAGSPVTGVKGSAEQNFRQGNVEISKANIGLGNVPNTDFTADVAASVKKFSDTSYQTVDQLAYNPTTKKLGLKVGGADTVIPFSGGADAKFYFNEYLQGNKVAQLKASNKLPNPNRFEGFQTEIPYFTYEGAAVFIPSESALNSYTGTIEVFGSNLAASDQLSASFDLKTGTWKLRGKTNADKLPYHFKRGAAVVLPKTITTEHGTRTVYEPYLIGGYGSGNATNFYKREYETGNWIKLGNLPYSFYDGVALVFNGEIHIFGSNTTQYSYYHYKWNGTSWTNAGNMTNPFKGGAACVYNGEIHLFSNAGKHTVWDGTSWTTLSNPPFTGTCAVTLNDGIHLFGYNSNTLSNNTKHSVWDGTNWKTKESSPLFGFVTNVPYTSNTYMNTAPDRFYVVDSRSHKYITPYIVGKGWDYNTPEYGVHGRTNYVKYPSSIGINYCSKFGATTVNYNGKIHFLGGYEEGEGDIYAGTQHWTFDGTTWEKLPDELPYGFTSGIAIVYNNEIHILGGYDDYYAIEGGYTNSTKHYKWDGTSWTEVATLPAPITLTSSSRNQVYESYYQLTYGCACVYHGELYLFASKKVVQNYTQNIYKFDGTSWTTVATDVFDEPIACAVVENDSILLIESAKPSFTSSAQASTSALYKLTDQNGQLGKVKLTYNLPIAVLLQNPVKVSKSGHTPMEPGDWYDGDSNSILYPKAFVLNNEVHLFIQSAFNQRYYDASSGYSCEGSNVIHLVRNNLGNKLIISNQWRFEQELPSEVIGNTSHKRNCSSFVEVLNGEIYSSYSDYYGKYNELVKLSKKVITKQQIFPEIAGYTTVALNQCGIVEYNNELHMLGGSSTSATQLKHYKWNGTSWTEVGTLPFAFYNRPCIVYKNRIYIFSGTQYAYFDGSSWSQIHTTTNTYEFNNYFPAVVYQERLYFFGCSNHTTKLICFNEQSSSQFYEVIDLPSGQFLNSTAQNVNGEIIVYPQGGSQYSNGNGYWQCDFSALYTGDTNLVFKELTGVESIVPFRNGAGNTSFPKSILHKGNLYLLFNQEYTIKKYNPMTKKIEVVFFYGDIDYVLSESTDIATLGDDLYLINHSSNNKMYKIIPETHYYIESGIDDITLE